MRFRWLPALLCMLAVGACAPSDDDGGGGGGSGSVDGGGSPPDPFIDASRNPPGEFIDAGPDANCGVQEEDIEVVNNGEPPDLLIVLDRSGSMGSPINIFDPFGPTMWQVMVDAIVQITSTHADNIRFGLAVFPTDNLCGVDPGTEVAIGDGTAGAIATWLGGPGPDGNTPAHLALDNALDVYSGIPVNPNGRYVLYATDGAPNCGGADESSSSDAEVITAIEALYAADVHTFVLGFGSPFGLDVTNLNAAALAGGEPKPGGPPHYYQAESAADLEMALEAIAGGIIVPSCTYELSELPPDPDAVTVTVDGVPVPRSPSHTDGWDYHPDASHITFFGSYCDMIQSGSSGSVRFSYGCPGPVVP